MTALDGEVDACSVLEDGRREAPREAIPNELKAPRQRTPKERRAPCQATRQRDLKSLRKATEKSCGRARMVTDMRRDVMSAASK